MIPADDQSVEFEGVGKTLDKEFKGVYDYVKKIHAEILGILKDTEGFSNNLTGNKDTPGGGKLGLGSFTRAQKIAGGMAIGAAVGSTYMKMAPNTMAAVTQRMAADSVAGLSGMGAQGVIRQSNRLVGNGATSAMGPTMATMQTFYQGGYTASSLSSKNIMSSIGGLSAITGGSNEQVAGSLAGMNSMNFLRMGVRIRDKNGELRPMNQIINDVYNFLYRGQQITKDQAAMLLNPGSKGYQTLMMITNGDQNLFNTIAMGVIARASKGKGLTKGDLSNSNKALDIMGVGKESPIRSNFRYQTSEARKLQSTEGGLVGGYNTGLRATATLNDGFSTMADLLGPVNDGLMALKGILQTMPAAGNMGGTVSHLTGLATGTAMNYAAMRLAMGALTPAAAAAGAAEGAAAGGGVSSLLAGGGIAGMLKGGKFGAAKGILAKGSMGAKLGRVGLAAGVYAGSEWLQKLLNKKGKNLPGWLKAAGNFAFDLGEGALTGLAAGGLPGAVAGSVAGGAGNLLGGGVGGDCEHGNVGCSHGTGGADSVSNNSTTAAATTFRSPVPSGTKINSPFGPRDNSKNPGISRNHSGVDYGVKVGTNITSAADGIVTETGIHRQYGNYVIIRHGNKSTLYGHLSQILVRKGQAVRGGEVIGKSGGAKGAAGAGNSTGPHLHFEVRDNGGVGAQGRKNPLSFIGKAGSFLKNLFTSGVNMVKRVIRGFSGALSGKGLTGFSDRDEGAGVGVSGLSSEGLNAFLNSSLSTGAPVSWKDIQSGVHKSTGINIGKSHDYVNSRMDRVSGDSGGMAGGSREGLIKLLAAKGFKGPALETAFAIALAESGGRQGAVGDRKLANKKWGPSYGLFQVRSLRDWKKYSDPYRDGNRLKGLDYNISAAWEKSNHGTNFKPWASYTSGSFAKFLDDANRAKGAAGVGGGDAGGGTGLGSVPPMETSHSYSGGGARISSSQNVNVKVDMHVNIARSSVGEAEAMFREFKVRLERELKSKGVGTY
jgi:hypothetical protein